MGGSNTKLSKEDEEAYKQLTYLSEKEIEKCYKWFTRLIANREELATAESINDTKFRVSIEDLVSQLPELKVNPFATRLCAVFSQQRRFMVFEEFLDMMSVLSENAPKEVKADWAFKMFDYDGNGKLDANDIRFVVKALTEDESANAIQEEDEEDVEGNQKKNNVELDVDKVVRNVLDETDINKSGFISLVEFKQIVSKSHDFKDNFRIKL